MSVNELYNEPDIVRLEDTQQLRLRIVKELTKDGIPDNKDDRHFLLEAMKDIDKSVYTKTRIKVSNKAADEQKSSNAIIAELLKRHTVTPSNVVGVIPVLDAHHRVTDSVDGETTIGVENLIHESFTE